MVSGRLAALLLFVGVAGAAGTVGCFAHDVDADTASDEVRGKNPSDAAPLLESTVLLSTGCTAAKVGPRHLLVAARCVLGRSEYASGQPLGYRIAAGAIARPKKLTDAGVADASDEDGGAEDAPEPKLAAGPTIDRVMVNSSFAAKCTGAADKCPFGSLAATDAKDIAVIIVKTDLKEIPTVPVDLDAVSAGDKLVTVGGGCRSVDAPPRRERLTRTIAVPAKAATHRGSVYEKSPALIGHLDESYVVTPGRGWRAKNPGLCRTDIGAPLFRADGTLAVAGVTAGYTIEETDDLLPVTLHHTRVDTASSVGPWLESLGVETIHSCAGAGCAKTAIDGDVPTVADMEAARDAADTGDDDDDDDLSAPDAGDAGDAGAGEWKSSEVDLGESDDDTGYSNQRPVYADAGKPKKTKTVMACAAAPGPIGGEAGAFGLVGLAFAVSLARRRGAPRRG